MNRSCPRLIVAALRGGAGKTTLSVAMAVALQKQGIPVVPFKKGPDYIDAAWLSLAASQALLQPGYLSDGFRSRSSALFHAMRQKAPFRSLKAIGDSLTE